MNIIIKIGILFFKLIYFFFKLLPTKNKVTFISRQSNELGTDFKLVIDKLKEQDVKIITLTKRLKKDESIYIKIKYVFHMFIQMYHIATSKVVVLDSYCILISLLNHKKELKVIQMWHALGSLKKFGYSIQDKKEGTSKSLSKIMHMHKNYDFILTSSKASLPNFAEAFGYDEDYFKIIPLPRVDLLNDKQYQKNIKNKIQNDYPILKNKKNILYAPTFRKNENSEAINKFLDSVDYNKYNVILKLHPLSNLNITNNKVIKDNKYSTLDMFFISDYIVTDYSAITYEAAFLKKPLFFYTYDIDTYINKRDFYIDYKKEMPGIISNSYKKIIKAIEDDNYDLSKIQKFSDKYIEYNNNSVNSIIDLILENMKE